MSKTRKMSRTTSMVVLMTMVLLATLGTGGALAQTPATATADLRDNEGNPVGSAEFVEGESGVTITVSITGGIEPGVHGIHIHETSDLSSSDFKSAGGHFNPTDAEHGFDNPKGPHAGDLENITVAQDGTASYQTVNGRITLSGGPNSILDKDGSALVIHAMADDYQTNDDPQTGPGTSGDRVAAGVIEAAPTAAPMMPETGGISLLSLAAVPALLVLVGASLLVFRGLRQA
jgi:Cu-Zn family superoxide dismutase